MGVFSASTNLLVLEDLRHTADPMTGLCAGTIALGAVDRHNALQAFVAVEHRFSHCSAAAPCHDAVLGSGLVAGGAICIMKGTTVCELSQQNQWDQL